MKRDNTLPDLVRIMEKLNDQNLSLTRLIPYHATCIEDMADDAIAAIRKLLAKPEIRSCRIPLVVDFKNMTQPEYWLNNSFFSKLEKKRGEALKEKLTLMAGLLKQLELKIKLVDPAYAERFIKRMMNICSKRIQVTDYDVWKAEHRNYTSDMLWTQQVQLTLDMLKCGVLEHDYPPSGEETQQVRLDLLQPGLESGTELTKEIIDECAKLRRYSYWEGKYMFMIDYHKLYLYLFRTCFEKLTKEQRLKLFEYDIQLQKIHEDLAELLPELKKCLRKEVPVQEEQNYFAIVKNVSVLLQQEDIKAMRTDKRYHDAWLETMLNDLMASEWGEVIAQEWRIKSKTLKLKCKITGAIKDAGVLDGSYQGIAAKLDHEGLPAETLANYMGSGKNEPYFDWICEYVRG